MNMEWVNGLHGHGDDVLLVAGDVSERIDTFQATMSQLADSFGCVFFVPGNHEAWVRRDGTDGADSLEKLQRCDAICQSLGVITTPQYVSMVCGNRVSVLPLLSFYHSSFDVEPDIACLRLPSTRAAITDYKSTRWPEPLCLGSSSLAEHVDSLNDSLPGRAAEQAAGVAGLEPIESYAEARAQSTSVLSFSHFLPRIDLIPEKRYLLYPRLHAAVGSRPLGRRVGALAPDMHAFGHTHFGWDATLDDGVRYVQAPLATPSERKLRPRSLLVAHQPPPTQNIDGSFMGGDPAADLEQALPLRLYDGERGAFSPPHRAAWSEHYVSTNRTPANITPAPWVVQHYLKRAPGRITLDGLSGSPAVPPRPGAGSL